MPSDDRLSPVQIWDRRGEYRCMDAAAMDQRCAAFDALTRLEAWLRADPARELTAGIDNSGIYAAVYGGGPPLMPVSRGETLAAALAALAAMLEDDDDGN